MFLMVQLFNFIFSCLFLLMYLKIWLFDTALFKKAVAIINGYVFVFVVPSKLEVKCGRL